MKKRKCSQCKCYFQQQRPLQYLCGWECATAYAKKKEEEKKEKAWKDNKKKLKDELKTHSDYIKELQTVFNKYIRERDKDKPCISCGNELKGKYDAGHYYSVGNYPALRFNEMNVSGQCVHCNQWRGGSLHEYREGLIKRIGIEAVEMLDSKRNDSNKLTIPELINLKEIYKEKIRKLQ
jgi:hypothetical protein